MDFIHDAYHDQTTTLVVPESLRMKKDVANRQELKELQTYMTKNRYCGVLRIINAEKIPSNDSMTTFKLSIVFSFSRYFVTHEDCADILTWIETEGNIAERLPIGECSTL